MESTRLEGEVRDESERIEKSLLGAAAFVLGCVVRVVTARPDERRVVVVGVDVLPIRPGQLDPKLAEINANGKVGFLEGVVKIATVDEDAYTIHRRRP